MAKESFFVTGGCGLTGTAIVQQLREKYPGSPITVMSRNPTVNLVEGVTYHAGDITKPEDVRRILDISKPSVVFHVAGLLVSARGRQSPAVTHGVNTEGTRIVLDECRKQTEPRVKAFIFTSSASVVQKNQRTMAGLDETAPLITEQDKEAMVYSQSKANAERLVSAADDPSGMRTASIRPAIIHGPNDMDLTPIFAKAATGILSRVQIGPNTARFATTYVSNAAQGHLLACDKLLSDDSKVRDSVGGEAFLITNDYGGDGPSTYLDLLREVWKGAGVGPSEEEWKTNPPWKISTETALWIAWASETWSAWFGGRPAFPKIQVYMNTMERWVRIDKAKRVLGYEPEVGWREGARMAGAVRFAFSPFKCVLLTFCSGMPSIKKI